MWQHFHLCVRLFVAARSLVHVLVSNTVLKMPRDLQLVLRHHFIVLICVIAPCSGSCILHDTLDSKIR